MKKLIFALHFFNQDILVKNILINTKSWIHIDGIHMEGTVSQIFEIGLTLYFIKCILIVFEKYQLNLPVFNIIIKLIRPISKI